jgi:steroid Delta-isomerase
LDIHRLIVFFETLSPDSIVRFGEFYAPDAAFKDPFNEVRGLPAIQRIFSHMFKQVDAPRFVVTGRVVDAGGAVLVWEFRFGVRRWGRGETQLLRGVSHLTFSPDGKVVLHRDYWDAAEELYMKLPLIGALMRVLRRMFAA